MSTPLDTTHSRSMMSRSFLPLALITLGVVFLLGNLVPGSARGGLVLLGLGAAFAIGRVTTGRYGYSVPAGVLVAIGAFVAIHETGSARGQSSAGWFFLLLGGGFVLTYFVGMRPRAFWPLLPAAVLLCLGLLLFGATSTAPLASIAWIVGYWPAALVGVGLWILFREHLPPGLRAPVATIGGIALLGYGVLAAIASVAAAGTLARPGFMLNFGGTPFSDDATFTQPIAAGQTFTVNNPNGRTVIHGGDGTDVHVLARRKFWVDGQPPEVRLAPVASGVSLDLPDLGRPTFGPGSSVDLEIDVPVGVQVTAESASGSLEIADLNGNVQSQTSSGSITLRNLGGDVRAQASSGSIRGTSLLHVRDVQTSSGSINLQGIFNDTAQVRSSSGSVQITFAQGSAANLDVRTGSGGINQHGLSLGNQRSDRRSLSGTLGTPAPGATLTIETSSGSVNLNQ